MKESIPLFKNIEKLLNLEFEKENYDRAKENLLDYIAVTYAGSKATSNILKDYIELNQVEEGSYHIYGTQYHTNFEEAVFLNGLNAHFLDYDDGSNAGIIHFGSPIYSLLIPLAKKYKMNLNEVLRASMIAYEFAYILANMIQPKHKLKGYHATGTIGTISSALAGAVLLGYDLEKIKNTISIASSASSGLLNVLDGGSELKAFNVAKAALMTATGFA